MAEYIGIKGSTIQTIAGDPANPIEGQVWYNSTSTTLKSYGKQGTGAWASGGTMAISSALRYGFGTQGAAGMAAGNNNTPGATELYNGTAWTTGNNVNDPRESGASCGTQTAAIMTAGESPAEVGNTEKYDGTTWTEVNNLTTARAKCRGLGTQTAALACGGISPLTAKVEEWGGTCWTEGNDLQTATSDMGAVGTVTSGLIFGGAIPGYTAQTETYDGTSWTETGDLNSARGVLGGFGTSNIDAMAAGGTPNTGATEAWNGTVWTEVADMATGREGLCNDSAGTSLAGLIAGGDTPGPGNTDTSEEWSVPDAIKTFTAT